MSDGQRWFVRKAAGGMAFEDDAAPEAEPAAVLGGHHVTRTRPLVVHVTTTDMSLELLLGPQLEQLATARVRGRRRVGARSVRRRSGRAGRAARPLRHATRRMAPVEDARALVELVALFRALRPAIVHTHNPKPGSTAASRRALARVPVVVNTVHGLYALPEDPSPKRAVVYGLERIAAACSDAELLQNEEDLPGAAPAAVSPRTRLTILGNGIDLERFDPERVSRTRRRRTRASSSVPTRADDVVVGVVGRLVREKGYPELFEAAAELRRRVPRRARRGRRPRRTATRPTA